MTGAPRRVSFLSRHMCMLPLKFKTGAEMVRHIKDVLNKDVRFIFPLFDWNGIHLYLSRAASWLLTPSFNLLSYPRKARIL